MVGDRSSCVDERQANAYEFPYHYIPNSRGFPWFSRRWSFSASYIAAVLLAEEWLVSLPKVEHHCHMDFGCGDGGFIHALKTRGVIEGVKFFGVDFDDHAIGWAKMFHDQPEDFSCGCISDLQEENYHSGSLIEVFEHIPPDEGTTFVANMAKSSKKLILEYQQSTTGTLTSILCQLASRVILEWKRYLDLRRRALLRSLSGIC